MNELQIFSFDDKKVRTVLIDDNPWWVLKDVCEILGIKNSTDVSKRLDDDERTRFNLGRQGRVNVINESGLYSVILRSDKPNAKPFRKWVTNEVLPTIRKTGSYTAGSTDEAQELALLRQEVSQIRQAIGEPSDNRARPVSLSGSRTFAKATTKASCRKSYINYLLTALEQLLDITRMEMMHQAYQALQREAHIDIELVKQRYIDKHSLFTCSTFDAICDDGQASLDFIKILHFNMELVFSDN